MYIPIFFEAVSIYCVLKVAAAIVVTTVTIVAVGTVIHLEEEEEEEEEIIWITPSARSIDTQDKKNI